MKPILSEVLKRAGVNPFIFMYLPTIQKIIDATIQLVEEKNTNGESHELA